MIKNVVFDLGNVLISFKPEEFLVKKNYSEPVRKLILADIFASREWLLLDNGDISVNEAIERISSSSALKHEIIEQIFNTRTEIFYSLDNNVKMLPELKKQGFKLYFLSNFPGDIFPQVKKDYSFFSYFDGGIISADARCSKPDHHIYRLLLGNYKLNAGECLYIDDLDVNVRSAHSVGMKGIVTHGADDISSLVRQALNEQKT